VDAQVIDDMTRFAGGGFEIVVVTDEFDSKVEAGATDGADEPSFSHSR
jgi:hypothetical protein